MTVYADILLALNWWIDYLLLLGVRRVMGGGAGGWRLALGALAGSLTCFVLFLPPVPVWLDLLIKFLAAAVMILVAFCWQGWAKLARRVFLLFAMSAGFAGVCGGLYFFVAPQSFYVNNGVVYYAVPPLLLVALTVLCYGVLWLWERAMRRRAPADYVCRLTIAVAERRVECSCLYDSGNHLVEPFSGYGVLVLEHSAAEQLLEIPTAEDIPTAGRWRLIPYDTLHGGGLLPAFIPDTVIVRMRGHSYTLRDCYVAVCDRLGRGEYQALMGTALGEQLEERGDK